MTSKKNPHRREPFRLGLNYWPASSALGWWLSFEADEVAADFERIAVAGFDSLRLFCTWEDFQPRPESVAPKMVERLVTTLDLAEEAGLSVMPTLFTGHMSGVNLIPGWALGGPDEDRRFRVISGGQVVEDGLENWFTDPAVGRAQVALARQLSASTAGHPALWAWDLGNESSNCVRAPSRAHARDWLMRVSDAIRSSDDAALITVGLHMEDLEQDRHLGPAEAAEACDFLTMHGYPGYASWARGPTDEALLPFLALVTRWLGGDADVAFTELGVPTYRAGDTAGRGARAGSILLVEETAAAAYIERALRALLECGCTAAMLWCYADYPSETWTTPPFDQAIHERYFGQWRSDGSPKPALAAVQSFARGDLAVAPPPTDTSWIDVSPGDFYRDPGSHLPRLYHRYVEGRGDASPR